MMKRRHAIRLFGSGSVLAVFATRRQAAQTIAAFYSAPFSDQPVLASGSPHSAERLGLIDAFRRKSEGFDEKFEARTLKSDETMPYRLFRPEAPGKLPLVVYLHGSGGLGDDNLKQLALGNIFGTRLWLLPENQKRFPSYVLAPQTSDGWVRYDLSQQAQGTVRVLPGLGKGARLALEIIDRLLREFPVDQNRIYLTGQSMGGAGVWHMLAERPNFFAGAVVCCGSSSSEDGTGSIETPLWNFHGDADKTVPVAISRERIAARRKAGGHPLSTEYPGVDHNVWQWAYTEPQLVPWLFSQKRA